MFEAFGPRRVGRRVVRTGNLNARVLIGIVLGWLHQTRESRLGGLEKGLRKVLKYSGQCGRLGC